MTKADRRGDWRRAGGEIVLRRFGAVGDVLCCTPTLAAIRAARPQSRLVFETDCPVALLGSGDADEVRGLRWESDADVDFQDAEFQHLWPDDPDAPRLEDRLHLVDAMARAAGLTLTGEARRPRLCLTAGEGAWARAAFPPAYIAVAVHTAARIRNWAGWDGLYERLREHTALPLILLGHRPGSAACRPAPEGVLDYRGATTHRQAFAAVAGATLFVGSDSSLSHAAGAFAVPSVVLGGAVRPEQRVHAGQTPLRATLPCIGCYHRPSDGHYAFADQCHLEQEGAPAAPDGSAACMFALTPETVLAACAERLKAGSE